MDLFSEQLVRSERAALERDMAHAEVLTRHVATARQVRRRRWLRTRRWLLLAFRRRGTATAPALTIRGATQSTSQ